MSTRDSKVNSLEGPSECQLFRVSGDQLFADFKYEKALEEMNGIGFNKLCVLAQLSESEIAKIKECVRIRVEQQN